VATSKKKNINLSPASKTNAFIRYKNKIKSVSSDLGHLAAFNKGFYTLAWLEKSKYFNKQRAILKGMLRYEGFV
jgi:hypothetical protein